MAIKTKYQPTSAGNGPVGSPCATLKEAVIQALSHDGFGVAFERDEDGVMRCYTSGCHIGNNPYHPNRERDAWPWRSTAENDDVAINTICVMFVGSGRCHDRYDIAIDLLDFDNDCVVMVNGQADGADPDGRCEFYNRWYAGVAEARDQCRDADVRRAELQRASSASPHVMSAVAELALSDDGIAFRGRSYAVDVTPEGSIRIARAFNDAARAAGLVGQEIGALYGAAQKLVAEHRGERAVACFVKCEEGSVDVLRTMVESLVGDYDGERGGIEVLITKHGRQNLAAFPADFQVIDRPATAGRDVTGEHAGVESAPRASASDPAP